MGGPESENVGECERTIEVKQLITILGTLLTLACGATPPNIPTVNIPKLPHVILDSRHFTESDHLEWKQIEERVYIATGLRFRVAYEDCGNIERVQDWVQSKLGLSHGEPDLVMFCIVKGERPVTEEGKVLGTASAFRWGIMDTDGLTPAQQRHVWAHEYLHTIGVKHVPSHSLMYPTIDRSTNCIGPYELDQMCTLYSCTRRIDECAEQLDLDPAPASPPPPEAPGVGSEVGGAP